MAEAEESETRKIWRERIDECFATGMPTKRWCELNGVSTSMFYKWLKTLREEDPDFHPKGESRERWMELSTGPAAIPPAKTATIEVGRVRITVPLGIEGTDVLGILEAVCAL